MLRQVDGADRTTDEVTGRDAAVVAEFRANAGRVGGMFAGAPIVLLTTTGARTGIRRATPLIALPMGERLYVFASAGGSARHPAWFHNLVAHPNVVVEFGARTFSATARVIEGIERERVLRAHIVRRPQFARYLAATSRTIPVVELTCAG